jgi:hypothetical protein
MDSGVPSQDLFGRCRLSLRIVIRPVSALSTTNGAQGRVGARLERTVLGFAGMSPVCKTLFGMVDAASDA